MDSAVGNADGSVYERAAHPEVGSLQRPQVLRTRRFVSADFGKFHLAQPANNQPLEPVSPGEVGDLYIGGWD